MVTLGYDFHTLFQILSDNTKKPRKLPGQPIRIPREMERRGREDRVHKLCWNREEVGGYGGSYHNLLL